MNEKDEDMAIMQKHKDWIRYLADLPEEKLKLEIHDQAQKDGAKYGDAVIKSIEDSMNAEVAKYREIQPYDPKVMQFPKNYVASTSSFNGDGYAGQSTEMQQQIPVLKEAGVFHAHGAINQDEKLNLSGGSAGLKWTGNALTWNGVDFVPIADATVTIPAEGNVDAKDVNVLIGGVAKGHEGENRTNFTTAVIANGDLSQVNLFERTSKTAYDKNNLTVTPYAQALYNVSKNKFNAGAGAFVEKKLGGGNSVFADASIHANDAFGESNITGNLTAGFAWGGAETTSELEQRLSSIKKPSRAEPQLGYHENDAYPRHSVQPSSGTNLAQSGDIKPVEQRISNSAPAKSSNAEDTFMQNQSEKFLASSAKGQAKIVDRMLDNAEKNGINRDFAKNWLLERFKESQPLRQNDVVEAFDHIHV